MQELKPVLESPNITKVLHDCQTAAMVLSRHSVRLAAVIDTYLMHHTLKQLESCCQQSLPRRSEGATAGSAGVKWPSDALQAATAKANHVDLPQLLLHLGFKVISAKVEARVRRDPLVWRQRPLSNKLLCYASSCVRNLLAAEKRLEKDLKVWVDKPDDALKLMAAGRMKDGSNRRPGTLLPNVVA